MALEIKENEKLANHSTFRIGGPARYFCAVKSKEELLEVLDFAAEKKLPFFAFGGGSNILFRDEGYKGLAIKIKISNLTAPDIASRSQGGREAQNRVIKCGAGVLFGQLIMRSMDFGLAGLEWGVGIPGTVAGAVAGNAGAYGHSISEFVKSVTVLDETESADRRIKKYSKEDCEFGYRTSRFKHPDNREIILEVEFALEKGDRKKSAERISGILSDRRGKLPPHPSAGSVFRNIILDELENKEEFMKSVPNEKIKGGKFPAAFLIEACGLKGAAAGGAKIADEHANFIVNADGAASGDVLELINLCKTKVREKFGVDLKEEIVILPRRAG